MAKTPIVLCIDDEAFGLQLRQVVLERAGYRVYTAQNGQSGPLFSGTKISTL